MNETRREKLLKISEELIEEAKAVVASQFHSGVVGAPTWVEGQILYRWWGKVKSFGHQLGAASKPWEKTLSTDPERNTLYFTKVVLGTLEAIRYEIKNDHLETFTMIVRAETLADLLDQAETLFRSQYHLAAGVLGRAVLEEHLRTVCSNLGCTPPRERPTIGDYNQALYGVQHYNKIKMKQIDALSAIGNEAAHNSPLLRSEDVKKMLADLPEVMESTGA